MGMDANCTIPDPRWLESYTSDWLFNDAQLEDAMDAGQVVVVEAVEVENG